MKISLCAFFGANDIHGILAPWWRQGTETDCRSWRVGNFVSLESTGLHEFLLFVSYYPSWNA